MADLQALQDRLGHPFKNVELLRLALTHPSVAHESGRMVQHNQRLEFLGDAVLQLTVTADLFARFPNVGEGPLTQARAQMVNRRFLAGIARDLDIGSCLVVGRGEEISGGRARLSALADALEAVIGAVYLDGGFDAGRNIVLRLFGPALGQMEQVPYLDNPKGELQERLQAESAEAPVYVVAASSGPDHDRRFECVVQHQGVELGRGIGKSKKEAESQAALVALKTLEDHAAANPAHTDSPAPEASP